MNQKEKKQLEYINKAERREISHRDLCEKLKVSSGGLGNIYLRLKRLERDDEVIKLTKGE